MGDLVPTFCTFYFTTALVEDLRVNTGLIPKLGLRFLFLLRGAVAKMTSKAPVERYSAE